jgi:23S rRNA pseudouridine1911/1915/1917 synthase
MRDRSAARSDPPAPGVGVAAGRPTGLTLLARLKGLHPDSSGRRLREWLRQGRVRLNGRVARDGRVPVATGDAVTLGPVAAPAFPAALRLLHEDADLLVIDKPPDLLTVATPRERHRTAYRLVWDYLAAGRPPRRPFIVHRLDRETSGLLVVAKSPTAKRRLQDQFQARTVERIYVALVEGTVRADHGTLETTLVEDPGLRVRSVRRRSSPGGPRAGRTAITHYRVLARGRDATLLEVGLGTGRRRQIRVQLAALGHPVVGDRVHGSRRDPLRRLCLHAARLSFAHPGSGRRVAFESAPPGPFHRLVSGGRGG